MKLTPKKWRARIQRSLELQKDRLEEAQRFMRAYAGDYNEKPKKTLDGAKDDASVNFIFSFVETVRPTLLPGTPKAFVEAEDPESEPQAPSYQATINHFARRLGLKKEFKKNIHDWFFIYAAFLTEWDYSEEPKYTASGDPEMDPDTATEENPEGEQAFVVLKDQPLAKRLHPRDVIWDPDADSLEETRWRARRLILTYSEFRALPGITPEMRKKVRPKTLPRDLMHAAEANGASSEKNWVILWRIYDRENMCTKLLVENEEVEDYLEDLPWPWEMDVGGDVWPITILENKIDYDHPYPFSQFKAFWGQLLERNTLRSILKSVVRRNAPGWFAKKGALDEEQKEKFTGSKIGEYVEANDPTGIVLKPQIQVAADFFAHDEQVSNDIIEVSGLIEYRAESIADTATEASILNSKSSIRKGEAKKDFNDFCAIIYAKIGQLCQQFLQEEVAIKIRKPSQPNELGWLKVTGETIQGDFHLTVKPGAEENEDEGLRRQQDLKFAELMAQNPWVNQRKLAERISRRHDIEPEEILKSQEEFDRDQIAAAEAENGGKKEEPKPLLDFSAIKVELLAPEVQAMVVAAALEQNKVPETLNMGGNAGAGSLAEGGPASAAAAPSMASPAPGNSVMPGSEVNQAPAVMPGQNIPPPTPVQPMSEMQGGKK